MVIISSGRGVDCLSLCSARGFTRPKFEELETEMPQLPSGRHVAITLNPLAALLDEADNLGNVHKIMAIKTLADLDPYIEVVFLLPEEEVVGSSESEFLSDSLPRPPGFVSVDSGFHVSEWDKMTVDWSEADKTSFRKFLEGRAAPLLQQGLDAARNAQKLLHQVPSPVTRILVGWCDAGCHPSQEEGWAESDVGSPEWDDYDVLAALGQMAGLFRQQSISSENWQVEARLQAFWNLVVTHIPHADGWPKTDLPVRKCASEAREGHWLEAIDEGSRKWFHEQGVVECVSLWNSLGDGFRASAPQPYGIIELVVISPEANRFFDSASAENLQ
jgi:hypothetical protein